MPRPLDGLVVLDLTRLLPGGVATMMLAGLGAEVIKVEEPDRGDYARTIAPALFAHINGGKKSVALNLKHARGREALVELAGRADVLIEGFRPGVMDRLGVGYETLRARNPRLIYATLTGYGQDGPYAAMAGHDINYLSLAGVLDRLGPPAIPGVQIADIAGGALQAVIGVLAALVARQRWGCGTRVDVSMLEGSQALLAGTGRNQTLTGRYACYNIYEARDGGWVSVGALEPKFWAELCRSLGCEQFIPDQFNQLRQVEIRAALAGIFRTRDAEEWFQLLKDRDCCVTPVRAAAEAPAPPEEAPRLGEHTREALAQAGFSQAQMDEMAREGAIA